MNASLKNYLMKESRGENLHGELCKNQKTNAMAFVWNKPRGGRLIIKPELIIGNEDPQMVFSGISKMIHKQILELSCES